MDRRHPYLMEVTRALMVLAVFLLTLSHQPMAAAPTFAGYQASLGTIVNCGFSSAPDALDHTPCHACRIGAAADLPPPPARTEPADLRFETALYAVADPLPQPVTALAAHRSRGPPHRA